MSLSTAPILAAAASNDVAAIRWLVERERARVDQLGDWSAPEGGPTPAMIPTACLYWAISCRTRVKSRLAWESSAASRSAFQ